MKQEILQACAKLFQVDAATITSTHKSDAIIPARFALCAALRKRGWSYHRIGLFLNRDRTTVRYAVDRANYRIERNPDYRDKVNFLVNMSYSVDAN